MFRLAGASRLLPLAAAAGLLVAPPLRPSSCKEEHGGGEAATSSTRPLTAGVVDGVTRRLGGLVQSLKDGKGLEDRGVQRGVHIFALTDAAAKAHAQAGGLPVVRVAEATISASLEDVARCWWHVAARKSWDSVNTADSSLVASLGRDHRLVYLQGKPKRGGIVASRDFSYEMCRVPVEHVNGHPGSALFVQVNRPEDVPSNAPSVRGDVNSLLLMEPLDATTTKVKYAIEVDVRGWLPTGVVRKAADDLPLVLAEMRDHLEQSAAVEAAMSDEELAKASYKLVPSLRKVQQLLTRTSSATCGAGSGR
jgi:hypothetical protein